VKYFKSFLEERIHADKRQSPTDKTGRILFGSFVGEIPARSSTVFSPDAEKHERRSPDYKPTKLTEPQDRLAKPDRFEYAQALAREAEVQRCDLVDFIQDHAPELLDEAYGPQFINFRTAGSTDQQANVATRGSISGNPNSSNETKWEEQTMGYEQKPGTGSLFKNRDRDRSERAPNLKGEALAEINGQVYALDLAAWTKDGPKAGRWLSLSVKVRNSPSSRTIAPTQAERLTTTDVDDGTF
jgi:hypothetical protein